jgi:hypothetical protein
MDADDLPEAEEADDVGEPAGAIDGLSAMMSSAPPPEAELTVAEGLDDALSGDAPGVATAGASGSVASAAETWPERCRRWSLIAARALATPLLFVPVRHRQWIGWLAAVTVFNAVMVWLAVVLMRM